MVGADLMLYSLARIGSCHNGHRTSRQFQDRHKKHAISIRRLPEHLTLKPQWFAICRAELGNRTLTNLPRRFSLTESGTSRIATGSFPSALLLTTTPREFVNQDISRDTQVSPANLSRAAGIRYLFCHPLSDRNSHYLPGDL